MINALNHQHTLEQTNSCWCVWMQVKQQETDGLVCLSGSTGRQTQTQKHLDSSHTPPLLLHEPSDARLQRASFQLSIC